MGALILAAMLSQGLQGKLFTMQTGTGVAGLDPMTVIAQYSEYPCLSSPMPMFPGTRDKWEHCTDPGYFAVVLQDQKHAVIVNRIDGSTKLVEWKGGY